MIFKLCLQNSFSHWELRFRWFCNMDVLYIVCYADSCRGVKNNAIAMVFFSLDIRSLLWLKPSPKNFDGNWMLDEAFTVKMMKIGKCPLKNWNQLCLTRTWQWTESFVELLAIAVGHLCQAMFMGLRFFFICNVFNVLKKFCEMAAYSFHLH